MFKLIEHVANYKIHSLNRFLYVRNMRLTTSEKLVNISRKVIRKTLLRVTLYKFLSTNSLQIPLFFNLNISGKIILLEIFPERLRTREKFGSFLAGILIVCNNFTFELILKIKKTNSLN